MTSAPGLAAIQQAAARLKGQIVETPCRHSRVLSQITGAEVWLKFENFQFTSSFKERGALNKLSHLSPAERHAGVAAMSAGNHAQGVAHHATRLGIPSTIVMPRNTPFTKVSNTRALGGEVVLHGETLAEAWDHLQEEFIRRRGMTLVHPYDDPAVIAGQGTVALEMLAEVPGLDTLVLPIGGGGLMAGAAIAARGLRPDIRLIGVQSSVYAGVGAALPGGPGAVRGGQTLAEGIAVSQVGRLTLPVIVELADEVVLVEEHHIERAIALLATIEKVVAEGAGAAGLAALLANPERYQGRQVGLVVSGGNIDPRLLASVLMRNLVSESRLISLAIDIEDRPGSLGRIADCIGLHNGNIIQVDHERLATRMHAKSARLKLLVEVQDEAHGRVILDELRRSGFQASLQQQSELP
ncbi:threonine ammonia-lyase [Solimonas sp. SE-A11]|uniref:threonine ammonia-lyase n=1 Tax=Solimonas sp. SE-A11 TaxID=3054954 RepID=UPI00259CD363|nr:threonine ammonia-lyase [Solimonas sp. SE-A11]